MCDIRQVRVNIIIAPSGLVPVRRERIIWIITRIIVKLAGTMMSLSEKLKLVEAVCIIA